jgi:hypothetical protein
MKSFVFAAATLLAGVSAYPTAGPQTWKVKVGGLDANGNATLTYDPPYVSGAMAGDQILFELYVLMWILSGQYHRLMMLLSLVTRRIIPLRDHRLINLVHLTQDLMRLILACECLFVLCPL